MRLFPASIVFFLLTAITMILQVIPYTGIFLMFLGASLWSVVLVNLGMFGTAAEAASGQVSRWWLILPIAWFGIYPIAAVRDEAALRLMRAQVNAHNSRIQVPFNPTKQSLVIDNEAVRSRDGIARWLVANYRLPVVYNHNPTTKYSPERYNTVRLITQADCKKIREIRGAVGADIHVSTLYHNESAGYQSGRPTDFCILSQPEAPTFPQIRVSLTERKERLGRLPTFQTTTVVKTPDGKVYRLRGGSAAPLRWFPMLAMGCTLNSGRPSWDCGWGFLRARFTPLLGKGEGNEGDQGSLAKALGLRRVSASERRGAMSDIAAESIQRNTAKALAMALANLNEISADPGAKIGNLPYRVLSMQPEILVSRSEQIMRALEGAVAASTTDRLGARENGRYLASLITKLPPAQFTAYGARILALYGSAGDNHWLWDTEPLLRRIGDLGAMAIPVAIRPRGLRRDVNGAGVESLCRIGLPARAEATQVLTQAWAQARESSRDERVALFVAMRRIGIAVPALVDERRGQMAEILKNWNDISPRSPRRVCAIRQEEQARRDEKYKGFRRSNRE